MNKQNLLPIALGIALSLGSVAAHAKDERTILRCKANTADGVASMMARHTTILKKRRTRERFKVSFEIAPGFGLNGDDPFEVGDVLQVRVDNQTVGEIELALKLNGDLGGELDFDTNVDRDAPDDTVPFPTNFPGVGRGTQVEVGSLGCSLQERIQ